MAESMHDGMKGSEPRGPQDGHVDLNVTASRWTASFILAVYVIALCIDGTLRRRQISAEPSFWDLQDTDALVVWLGDMVAEQLMIASQYLVLGGLVAWAIGRTARGLSPGRILAWAWVVCGLLVCAIKPIAAGGYVAPELLLCPMLVSFVGAWLVWELQKGFVAWIWMVPKLAFIFILLVGGAVAFMAVALEAEPLAFEAAQVTSKHKRRLVSIVRESHFDRPMGHDSRRLRLSEGEIDLLIAWGLSLGDQGRKARVILDENRATLLACMAVPVVGMGDRYLNFQVTSGVNWLDQKLDVRIERLQVGRLQLPAIVGRWLSDAMWTQIHRDPDVMGMISSVMKLKVMPDAFEVIYRSGGFGNRAIPSLVARLGAHPDLIEATRSYVHHLIESAPAMPRGEERFGAFLHTAFAFAMQRSVRNDPIAENRAAIYALALLLGHSKIELLIGPVIDQVAERQAEKNIGRVTLRRRVDWTKHFFVSSVLAIMSTGVASDAVGLLKEELDAGWGGSGFSFADLLADRAGTLFALAATRDEYSARQMQQGIVADFQVGDVFPSARGLPEGVTDQQLAKEFGGIQGEEYKKLEQEIERRLESCRALR